jgi:hypothetical protein
MYLTLVASWELLEKKTYGYEERNEKERTEVLEKLGKVEKNKIIYVDEAGFDNRDDYPYGYSPRGERCYGMKSGKRTPESKFD